jgi:hypothetical protein
VTVRASMEGNQKIFCTLEGWELIRKRQGLIICVFVESILLYVFKKKCEPGWDRVTLKRERARTDIRYRLRNKEIGKAR